jgi:HAD superfamily hydrolase (TIGR01509 family)
MNNILVLILSITALLALYWVLIGQWKQNAMLRQQNRKIKAVLFDLDGVLIDSHDAWFKVFNHTREKFKLKQISEQEFDTKVWGGSIERDAGNYFKKIKIEKIASTYKNSLLKFKKNIKINPYAHYLIKNIKDKKLKTGVITNSFKNTALKILDYHGIKKAFDVIIGGDEVEHGKPAPDSILKACEALNIKPEEALLVGDTMNDINAGKNAGCFTIGYKVHGDLMVDDLKDIARML